MNFNERLRWLRTTRGLTQLELSTVLHYGYTAISNYESGRNEPSISGLKTLANYFNVSLDYLLGYQDQPKHTRIIRLKKKSLRIPLLLAHSNTLLTKDKQQALYYFIQWLLVYDYPNRPKETE